MAKKKKTKTKRQANRIKIVIRKLKKLAEDTGFIIHTADECHNPFDLRRPSSLMSLDLATGGGLPAGGLSQIDGPESSGKNYMLFQYMRACQDLYGSNANIGMACFEHMIDKDFARKAGIQIAYDRYEIEAEQRYLQQRGLEILSKGEITKKRVQLGEFVIIRGQAEDVMDGILELVASNEFQIVGIDSWETVLPNVEVDKELSKDPKMAARASLQSRFVGKLHHFLNRKSDDGRENETTLIATGQVRDNIQSKKMFFSKEFESKTARAVRHGKLVDINLKSGSAIRKSDGTKIGKNIKWEVMKGKAGCHEGGKGQVEYQFEPPRMNFISDLITVGVKLGAVKKKGDVHVAGDFEGSEKDLARELRTNEILRKSIAAAILYESELRIRYV